MYFLSESRIDADSADFADFLLVSISGRMVIVWIRIHGIKETSGRHETYPYRIYRSGTPLECRNSKRDVLRILQGYSVLRNYRISRSFFHDPVRLMKIKNLIR